MTQLTTTDMRLMRQNKDLPFLKFRPAPAVVPGQDAENPPNALSPAEMLELRRLQQIWDLRQTSFAVLPGPDGPQGFIRLVDCFGSDDRIVETARLTAQTEGKSAEDDVTLLRYLMRHLHTTPLEFGEIVVHVRVPMDTWRQWVRHRTASINEYSTRYSEAIDGSQRTLPDQWRTQSETNRQGSGGRLDPAWLLQDAGLSLLEHPPQLEQYPDKATVAQYLSLREQELQLFAREIYQERIAFGVAKEVARKDLPLSTFTEAYWKIDVHNLLHFLALRMDSHAQQEIRDYATAIGEQLVAKLFPVTWQAFLDYRLHALRLTRLDVEVIQRIAHEASRTFAEACDVYSDMQPREASYHIPPYSAKVFMDYQDPAWRPLKRCRERVECWAKLEKLGLVAYKEGEFPIQ